MRPLSSVREARPLDDEPRQSLITELLFPLPAHRRTTLGILVWWESRRLLYNAIVGTAGLVTLAVLGIMFVVAPPPNETGPMFPGVLLPVFAYGVLANVCYTLGPIIETTLERVWKDQVLPIGPALFRQGLAFSIGLTLLPIPMVICFEIFRFLRFVVT
jgi:hypothetical protein